MMNKRTMNVDSTIEMDFAVPSVERNCDSLLRAVPDVQVPDVQVSDIQVPDVQVPDIQMPDVQVPDVQVPDVQMPDVQMPDVQMPDVQVPAVQVPDLQVPDVQMPAVQVPVGQMPDLQVPDVQMPDVQMPDVQMPDVQVPDVQMPDVQMPDVQMPDVQMPDVQMPEVQVPDVQVPDVQVPDVQVPDVQVPDVQVPDVQVPDVQVPDFQMPDGQMPHVQVPDVQMPDFQVPDLNDDLTIGMNSAVPSVERNHDSLLKVITSKRDEIRRKRERKRLKPGRWNIFDKICLTSDEIVSDNTKAFMVFPGVISHRSGRRRRKRKACPSESSSPEDSSVLSSSEEISLKYSKDPPDFPKYQLIITNGAISRTESWEKMNDGDFIIKMIDSHTIYRDFCNRRKSLKYLYKIPSIMKNYKYFYLEAKYNKIFNECFNNLDEKAKEAKKSKKQFAFVVFKKKDGSLDKSRTEVHYHSKTEHTEDKIFKLLLKIYHESNCDYSEMYIYSTNSPCLARHNHVPCMIQAFFIANMLHEKHGIKTIIGYLKPWGLSGSCEKNVPSYSIKDSICTSSQKTNNDREDDNELLIAVYKKIIPEVQNQTFLMEGTESKPEHKLKQFYSKISNSEIKKQLNKIVQNLFKTIKCDLFKTSTGFHEYGLEMFGKCTKEISDLLIDDYANIIEEICSYLKEVFLRWWFKKVDDGFSKILKEQLVGKLLKNSLHLFLLEIKKMEKKLGTNFFEIGYMVENETVCNLLM
ncbi:uncharacterized protein LOC143738112 isoform X2 [Siphateles boraxobius]|uniref:uncharacterized protein LOC143738112 isoform X2 n=1 Tax=Siphateles boraxobius TaxID=180520 RepID=UPI00406313EC